MHDVVISRGLVVDGSGSEPRRADEKALDPDPMAFSSSAFEHNYPVSADRFVQRPDGYRSSAANREVFTENSEHAGALAGRPLLSS
jgi:hypothetical protein